MQGGKSAFLMSSSRAANALFFILAVERSRAEHAIPGNLRRGLEEGPRGEFRHGVASGSPLPDAMVFWTRYPPLHDDLAEVDIEYRIAEVPAGDVDLMDGEAFAALLNEGGDNEDMRYGIATATEANDWVVKLDITGLNPATTYVYAFTDGHVTTHVGRTKTPPLDGEPLDSMRFAVFSCANYTNGYFHAYDVGSTIKDLDFWFHAGDYIYE